MINSLLYSLLIIIISMQNTPVKVIQLQDQYVDTSSQFPYFLSNNSNIRFRLRSKLCSQYQPILLIEKIDNFHFMLPLKTNINISSEIIQDNFTILYGNLREDGAWEARLPPCHPGVVNFQLMFLDFNSTVTAKVGSCDSILLCQHKIDLRKLRSLSVFGRCIGPHTQWVEFFRRQKAIGYNAIHLAPIQQTGECDSYYSLKSHIELSSKLFSGSKQEKNNQLRSILQPLKKQGMRFFIDIVLNHSSLDADWIKYSPDAVFTLKNTPMLYTAYLVDDVIFQWGEEVKEMLSFDVQFTQDILNQIEQNLRTRLSCLKLYEYFQLSPQLEKSMLQMLPTRKPSDNIFSKDPIELIQIFLNQHFTNSNHTPYDVKINNLQLWASLNIAYQANDLKLAIEAFNNKWKNKIENEWTQEIVNNTMNYVRANYFQNKNRSFDDPEPLVQRYFSRVAGYDGQFLALNNGYIEGNVDTRQLFVTSREYHYLRRRVTTWGVLRIRYGDKISDSPAAWSHMLEYVKEMARQFDGFRMDNFHGTPISVARYLIRQARKVNPDLLVFAELFTNTDAQTAEFVKRTGINSTVKEALNILSGDQFVDHFHHQISVISPYLGNINRFFIENGEVIKYATRKRPVSLVYDLTHDNETYITMKKAIIQTPVAFILSMAGTFTGSTKGFDQFYTKKILVTQLNPLYQSDYSTQPVIEESQLQAHMILFSGSERCCVFGNWNNWKESVPLSLDQKTKLQFVTLHLPPGDYQFKFNSQDRWILDDAHQENEVGNHFFKITKNENRRMIYRNLQPMRASIADLAQRFFHFKEYHVYNIGNIVIIIRQPTDHIQSFCAIANLSCQPSPLWNAIQLEGYILDCYVWLQSDLAVYEGQTTQTQITFSKNIRQFFDVTTNHTNDYHTLRAAFIPPGFACFLHCRKNDSVRQTINAVQSLLLKPSELPPLGPLQINGLFFNCNQEEQQLWGNGTYVIPQSGNFKLVYAGFAGVFQMILRNKRESNLNEGVFQNLREGNWLLDYYLNRVRRYKHLSEYTQYLQKLFNRIGMLPRYLIPKYFSQYIYTLILELRKRFKAPTDFQSSLLLATCQFINYMPSCALPDKTLLAAGLPHFAVGWTRCWGRDTFTSSDILRLYPNIFRQTILQYASTMRHGLIPNLLDEGKKPRFNSRDSCWWFIKSVHEYIQVTKDYDILKNKVEMIIFSDHVFENEKQQSNKKRVLLLQEIILQIFQSHCDGIAFREWSSGCEIDPHTSNDGFNIHLETDPETGFIFGGNPFNALTWMDKIGSSVNAGNKGVPATPRAGSPVQLVGLLYYCLKGFNQLNRQGHFTFNGVQLHGKFISFSQWGQKIKQHFELYYFLKQKNNAKVPFVRGIYKDLVGSPSHFDQQRFRPNALVTLAVAPQLCKPENAICYIKKVQQYLLHPSSIGVATLADMHSIFWPVYDLNNDSNDHNIAQGFSYHNGPEWVWLYGYYLVAKFNFQKEELTKRRMMALLQQHIKTLNRNQWQSLPQMTNRNGEANMFSCHAQAWSVAAILMALRKIQSLPDII